MPLVAGGNREVVRPHPPYANPPRRRAPRRPIPPVPVQESPQTAASAAVGAAAACSSASSQEPCRWQSAQAGEQQCGVPLSQDSDEGRVQPSPPKTCGSAPAKCGGKRSRFTRQKWLVQAGKKAFGAFRGSRWPFTIDSSGQSDNFTRTRRRPRSAFVPRGLDSAETVPSLGGAHQLHSSSTTSLATIFGGGYGHAHSSSTTSLPKTLSASASAASLKEFAAMAMPEIPPCSFAKDVRTRPGRHGPSWQSLHGDDDLDWLREDMWRTSHGEQANLMFLKEEEADLELPALIPSALSTARSAPSRSRVDSATGFAKTTGGFGQSPFRNTVTGSCATVVIGSHRLHLSAASYQTVVTKQLTPPGTAAAAQSPRRKVNTVPGHGAKRMPSLMERSRRGPDAHRLRMQRQHMAQERLEMATAASSFNANPASAAPSFEAVLNASLAAPAVSSKVPTPLTSQMLNDDVSPSKVGRRDLSAMTSEETLPGLAAVVGNDWRSERGEEDVEQAGNAGVAANQIAEDKDNKRADASANANSAGNKDASTSETAWKEAFHKVQDDNEVHHDDLPRALELAGFASPTNQKWIDDIFAELTRFTTLEEAEFLHFVEAYLQKQRAAYREAFCLCDGDDSGMVEEAELAELLKSFGIEPMKHVLEEVFQEIDEDRTGSLDLEEFEQVMELIVAREGFTKREYDDFMGLFNRYDRDNSGEVDTKELLGILNWLGYSWDKDRVTKIVKLVDINQSGTLDPREFLMCMRKVREQEVEKIIQVMKTCDADGSGTISLAEMVPVLHQLGYDNPSLKAIKEACEGAGVGPSSKDADQEFDLSALWQMLVIYRDREGLDAKEAGLIDEAFKKHDTDGEGELSTLQVGKVMRYLGYPMTFEVQQSMIAKVDVDGTGKVDLKELRKMVRMYCERQVTAMRASFMAADPEHRGAINKDLAMQLLESQFGHVDKLKVLPEEVLPRKSLRGSMTQAKLKKLSQAGVDISTISVMIPMGDDGEETSDDEAVWDQDRVFVLNLGNFLKVGCRAAGYTRDEFREQGGFTASQVAEMKETFSKFDKDNSGDISSKELIVLIEAVFPEMANSPQARPALLQIMHEVDANGDGGLDFQDFLRLMQQFRELQDKERMKKEAVAIAETAFTPQEVEEFRDLFLAVDDGSGELDFEDVRKMIQQITPLGDKYLAELKEIFYRITARQMAVEGNRDQADFAEFLWLMQELLENNFAHIKEKTQEAVRLKQQS